MYTSYSGSAKFKNVLWEHAPWWSLHLQPSLSKQIHSLENHKLESSVLVASCLLTGTVSMFGFIADMKQLVFSMISWQSLKIRIWPSQPQTCYMIYIYVIMHVFAWFGKMSGQNIFWQDQTSPERYFSESSINLHDYMFIIHDQII